MADWTFKGDLELLGVRLPERGAIDGWAAKLKDRPCENTLAVVGLAALLFYKLEKGHNPKVKDVWDSLVYCSTCISVGYGDIFPHTPAGKVLGSALMTMGPAMAAKTADGPGRRDADPVQTDILETLREILDHLKRQGRENELARGA